MQIRAELTASHHRVWQQLAAPGTWLTGTERVALARELRAASNYQLCQQRKTALSPGAIKGHHDAVHLNMPAARVELIHRLTTDPGRITNPAPTTDARERLANAIGDRGVVDAAAVTAMFQLNPRAADAAGIPIEERTAAPRSNIGAHLGFAPRVDGKAP